MSEKTSKMQQWLIHELKNGLTSDLVFHSFLFGVLTVIVSQNFYDYLSGWGAILGWSIILALMGLLLFLLFHIQKVDQYLTAQNEISDLVRECLEQVELLRPNLQSGTVYTLTEGYYAYSVVKSVARLLENSLGLGRVEPGPINFDGGKYFVKIQLHYDGKLPQQELTG